MATDDQKEKARERVRRFREKKRAGNAPRINPSAVRLALERPIERPHYTIQPPTIMRGVVPEGIKPQVAMDEAAYESARMAVDAAPQFGSQLYAYSNIEGFPGYPEQPGTVHKGRKDLMQHLEGVLAKHEGETGIKGPKPQRPPAGANMVAGPGGKY